MTVSTRPSFARMYPAELAVGMMRLVPQDEKNSEFFRLD